MPPTLKAQYVEKSESVISDLKRSLENLPATLRSQYDSFYEFYIDLILQTEYPLKDYVRTLPFGITENPREPFSPDDLLRSKPRFVSLKLDIDMLDDFEASYKDSKYIDELVYIITDTRHCIWLQETFDPARRNLPLESQDTFTKDEVENMRLRALQFLFLLSFKTFKDGDKYYQVDFFLNTLRTLAESTNISPLAFSVMMVRFEQNIEEYIKSIKFKEGKNRKFVEELSIKLEVTTTLYADLVFATGEES